LIDIDNLSNGQGKTVYGGRLDAYSFIDTNCEQWFEKFTEEIISSIGKKYYPVYRIADGELRFLFGPKVNWNKNVIKSILSYIKYKILKRPWKTSWGEEYSPSDLRQLKDSLQTCVKQISLSGKMAIYWNENGLNAFTEYNKSLIKNFEKLNITINAENYIPFHFGQALIAKNPHKVLNNRNILFVSGINESEFSALKNNMITLGAKNVELYTCSSK